MKRIIITLLLSLLSVSAYPMAPGTLLDQSTLSGQYTVSALTPGLNFSTPEFNVPNLSLCKEKGLPVIITFACGKAPWWALATGTGYVLIKQLDDCTANLYCSLASGSSYAIGEAITQAITDKNYNHYVQGALQACLATSCACVNMTCENTIIKSASISVLTAIGFNMLNIISAMVFENKKPESAIPFALMTPQERIKKILDEHPLDGYNLILKPYLVAASIVFGGITLATPAAYAAAITYLKNCPLPAQTLLTESAYRVTKKACDWYSQTSSIKASSDKDKK